jgi:hypothetical protein
MIAQVQPVDLPFVLQSPGDHTQIILRAKQPVQQDQGLAFATDPMIKLDTHKHPLQSENNQAENPGKPG